MIIILMLILLILLLLVDQFYQGFDGYGILLVGGLSKPDSALGLCLHRVQRGERGQDCGIYHEQDPALVSLVHSFSSQLSFSC